MKLPSTSFLSRLLPVAAIACAAPLLSSAAPVDMNFSHGIDIYSYGQPTAGPDMNINAGSYLRSNTLQGRTTRRSEWLQMSSGNYYGHLQGFNSSTWQYALPPNTTYATTGNSARLYKGTLNNPTMSQWGNPAGVGGLYTAMDRVSYLLWEESPVEQLHTVVFQTYMTTGSEPGFTTEPYQSVDGDFYVAGGGLPVLTVFYANGTSQSFTAEQSISELYESNPTVHGHIPVEGSEEGMDLYIYENYRSYRWDLNNLGLVASEIVRFGIEFTLEAHVSFRSMSLDQAGGLVPEPSHIALLLGGVSLAALYVRRRRQAA